MIKRFNLENQKDEAKKYIDSQKGLIEIQNVKENRSTQQNRALHLFFTIVSNQLNELGQEFIYFGLSGRQLSMPFTPILFKNMIWRELQKAMYGIESTTKINTEQINGILDVLVKHFGEMGISVSFPNRFDEYLKFYKE